MKLLIKFVLLSLIVCGTSGMASTAKPTPKTVYGSWDTITAASVPQGIALSVGGWGADTAAKPTPTSGIVAKVFVDGNLAAKVPMGGDRPDVTEYYGFANSGFVAVIETSALTVGQHIVEIWIEGGPSGSNHYTTPVKGKGTFTVTNPHPAAPAPAK